MSAYRGRGRPTRQTSFIPPDGFVTVNVDSIREPLTNYMAQQAGNVSLGMAIKDLLEMALAVFPEEAAIHIERRRAHQEAQKFVYRALAANFSQILADLERTTVLLENNEVFSPPLEGNPNGY